MINTQNPKAFLLRVSGSLMHSNCIKSDTVPAELIPVADLSLGYLRHLYLQISDHLPQE